MSDYQCLSTSVTEVITPLVRLEQCKSSGFHHKNLQICNLILPAGNKVKPLNNFNSNHFNFCKILEGTFVMSLNNEPDNNCPGLGLTDPLKCVTMAITVSKHLA